MADTDLAFRPGIDSDRRIPFPRRQTDEHVIWVGGGCDHDIAGNANPSVIEDLLVQRRPHHIEHSRPFQFGFLLGTNFAQHNFGLLPLLSQSLDNNPAEAPVAANNEVPSELSDSTI